MIEDKSGNLWLGTNGAGLSKYNPSDSLFSGAESFTNFSSAQGLAYDYVYSIKQDRDGDFWFGTLGQGISRFDGQSFINLSTAHGLANDAILSIFQDKIGNLWFGTEKGLSVLPVEKVKQLSDLAKASVLARKDSSRNTAAELEILGKSPSLFKTFTTKDGLPDNFVCHVLQLEDGRMAIGTNEGITLFLPTDALSQLREIETYNTSNGFPVKAVNIGQNCLFQDSKGILWVGTGSQKIALVRFNPEALRKDLDPPTLIIESIKIEDEDISWHNLLSARNEPLKEKPSLFDSIGVVGAPAHIVEEVFLFGSEMNTAEREAMRQRFGNLQFDGVTPFYSLPIHLVIPYEHNQIGFEFVAIETDRPSLVKYQYILEGYDKDWNPITHQSNVRFGNIPEGSYTFKIKAQSANGVWSEPITYSFKVLPPWYRTWWAYLMYAVSFFAVLFLIIKWREQRLRDEKTKLEKTVEERTEELFIEKKKSDDLLLNILPEEIAEELKVKGRSEAQLINFVTVLFTDFRGFTTLSEKLSPKELVKDLHFCFSEFDRICEKYGVEKIKTIGDAYMAAGGLPISNDTHAQDVLHAALEMVEVIQKGKAKKIEQGLPFFEIRIGVHTGPVVAGIVGT